MRSASNARWQTVLSALLSLVIATGLWYLVVGRDHVETQVELRVEYRGLPSGLVVGEGLINQLSVRLRGSAELLRNLHSRDLTYTVDLSSVQRGANALPLSVGNIPDLKPFEIMEVMPSRLVIEADALTERVVPLAPRTMPLPSDSPYVMSSIILEPSFVTIKGPEMKVNTLERLLVIYDPNKNASEGQHQANVAISTPPQIEVTPPVTSLRYTLDLKTRSVTLSRKVQAGGNAAEYQIVPDMVEVELSVPESLVNDTDYLDAVRIVVRPPAELQPGEFAELTPLAMLPSGARLGRMEPAAVRVARRTASIPEEPAWTPAQSPFSMPANMFGMELSKQRITRDFSLDDLDLPAATIPQADDLKVQPVIPSEAGKDRAGSGRSALGGTGDAVGELPSVLPPALPAAPLINDMAKPIPSQDSQLKGLN